MALPRVYDIAKELGIDSKVALAKLAELGEFVKSGSSTIAPPVAKKLREAFPDAKPKEEAPKKAAAKKTAAKVEAPVEEVAAAAPVKKTAAKKTDNPFDATIAIDPMAPAAEKSADTKSPAEPKKAAAAKSPAARMIGHTGCAGSAARHQGSSRSPRRATR